MAKCLYFSHSLAFLMLHFCGLFAWCFTSQEWRPCSGSSCHGMCCLQLADSHQVLQNYYSISSSVFLLLCILLVLLLDLLSSWSFTLVQAVASTTTVLQLPVNISFINTSTPTIFLSFDVLIHIHPSDLMNGHAIPQVARQRLLTAETQVQILVT